MFLILRMLTGIAAWVWCRKRRRANSQTASWYDSATLGEWCGSDTHCIRCRTNGDCDSCDTIDGRHMDAVAEHAQTCDSCADLTKNESLTMHPTTHLLYCERCLRQGAGEEWAYKVWECGCGVSPVYTDTDCAKQLCPDCGDSMVSQWPTTTETVARHRRAKKRSPYRHGWYSVENDRALGHYYCTAVNGGTVRVTNVTQEPTGGLAGWPDAVYMGEVVPPDEGGICRSPERFGKPWKPPWEVRNPCRSS